MPEETEDFIHIPARKEKEFQEGSLKTITLSATKGIKAVKGKLTEDDGKIYILKYLFDKSKGWNMSKAKKWIQKKKDEKDSFDIGLSREYKMEVLTPMKKSEGKDNGAERLISGYATMSSFNRNGYHVTNDAFNNTMEEFMQNPVLLYMHYSDLVIGSVLEFKVDNLGIFVKAQLLTEGKSEIADEAWNAIEEGSLKAFSIGFLVLAYERVCMDKELCFFSITEGELLELSVVSVPAVRGSYFKVVEKKEASKESNLFLTTSVDMDSCDCTTVDNSMFWTVDATTGTVGNNYWWNDTTANGGYDVTHDFELDDNIKVKQIIVDKEEKVKPMVKETPNPEESNEDSGEDLSSTENNDEMLTKLNEVLEIQKEVKAERAKLKEQNLDLLVKKTMTLFESVENKADIKPQLVAIVENGGEVALTATIEIIKSVMESKIIIDDSLTESGGEVMNTMDKQSTDDLGGTVSEVVANIMDEHKRKEGL